MRLTESSSLESAIVPSAKIKLPQISQRITDDAGSLRALECNASSRGHLALHCCQPPARQAHAQQQDIHRMTYRLSITCCSSSSSAAGWRRRAPRPHHHRELLLHVLPTNRTPLTVLFHKWSSVCIFTFVGGLNLVTRVSCIQHHRCACVRCKRRRAAAKAEYLLHPINLNRGPTYF